MAEIILITGGARSGKSRFAQELAESLGKRCLFVATCPVTDEEMSRRIARHRDERRGRGWETVEEPLELAAMVEGSSEYDVVLIDCLTLWINNLLFKSDPAELTEDEITEYAGQLVAACGKRSGTVILVTNEVGLGIVPENPLARLFRDLVGRCNQQTAQGADRVYLITCGIAQSIKEKR
ncbi:MAG: bifunctional adenosylcobinamide kinase/adenosylcobinamide-phosphate guanylyltransferase [Proteobacteria bacterium]|nr:bifunctional adenosylcobinamide kinase/adenosylcobinamide-phosphate guanylyltransferase [Pseudomonadota bacterium]MBU1687135.1 bifunctional adenosylcobinamide kinase/adenosylcobinamide-phosphate guanylyltransferase [Pseudomonadota bacterium]